MKTFIDWNLRAGHYVYIPEDKVYRVNGDSKLVQLLKIKVSVKSVSSQATIYFAKYY